MAHVRSDDREVSWAEHSFRTVDPDSKLSLDDDPGLLLRVLMLVHIGGPGRDLIPG